MIGDVKNTINAIRGKKHCGWCIDLPPTRMDKWLRFDQILAWKDRRWYERLAIKAERISHKIGIWKIGEQWHWSHHEERRQMAKLAIGQEVCDCRWQHHRIKSIDTDGDTITLDDGFVCSYIHCCDDVPHPELEHPEGNKTDE